MASCYRIPYTDRFGAHTATKWGATPAEAVGYLRKARDIPGCGATEIGLPQLVTPQPFDTTLPAIAFDPVISAK